MNNFIPIVSLRSFAYSRLLHARLACLCLSGTHHQYSLRKTIWGQITDFANMSNNSDLAPDFQEIDHG